MRLRARRKNGSVSELLWIGVAALIIAAATPATAGAPEAVIIASTVPGYAPGDPISVDKPLSMPSGTSVAVLLRSGDMIRMRGPYEGRLPAAAASGSAAAVVERLRLDGIDVAVIGGGRAVSGGDIVDRDVRIDASATYCFTPSSMIWILRPAGAVDGVRFGLRRGGIQREFVWPPGAPQIQWPLDLSIGDGDRFELIDVARDVTIFTIEFRAFRPDPAAPRTAAALVAAGCRPQAAQVLGRLVTTVLSPELALLPAPRERPRDEGSLIAIAQATHDGYLYCLAVRADGTALRLSPRGNESAAIRGGIPIPVIRSAAFANSASDGSPQSLRCYFSKDDISRQLPPAFFAATSYEGGFAAIMEKAAQPDRGTRNTAVATIDIPG